MMKVINGNLFLCYECRNPLRKSIDGRTMQCSSKGCDNTVLKIPVLEAEIAVPPMDKVKFADEILELLPEISNALANYEMSMSRKYPTSCDYVLNINEKVGALMRDYGIKKLGDGGGIG